MSASQPAPQKRKRAEDLTDGPSDLAPADPVRSDIWFEDGNVILQAEGVQFKVLKSILARSSPVFGDTFSIPQPPASGTNHTVDGCPIVHLSDSAKEIGYVLKALFQNEYMGYDEELPIAVIAAFLCLGRKYNIKKLEREARRRLYRAFPLTLKESDALNDALPGTNGCHIEDGYIDILSLARRAEMLSILPRVLYMICTLYSRKEIAKGWVNEGVTRCLPLDERAVIFAGLDAIYSAQAQTTFAWLYHPAAPDSGCTAPLECDETRQKTLIANLSPAPLPTGLDSWESQVESGPGLCISCAEDAQARHTAGRHAFWEQLPSLFDLPPWAELQKERQDLSYSRSLDRRRPEILHTEAISHDLKLLRLTPSAHRVPLLLRSMAQSDIEPPQQKRKRAENSTDESAPIEPVRSDIWYADGNVILQAEGVHFKVHKSILAQSSSIFEDMFSLPQPPSSGADTMDGCPIVHLSDSAQEVEYVLRAIFQQQYMGYEEELPVAVVAAFLCLGRKYDMKKLEREARRRLYKAFPLTMRDADALYDSIPGIIGSEVDDTYIDILALARRGEVYSILPRVLYVICTIYTPMEIAKGWEKDGITRSLPLHERAAIFAGLDNIYFAQAKTTFEWLYHPDTPVPGCTTPSECHKSRQATAILNFNPTPRPAGLDYWEDHTMSGPVLCRSCFEKAQMRHTIGRQEFWEKLPSLFDLPPWAELQKEREDLI
ncbi:hypothetical protein HWV62_28126 [Athelia sp. TMB]|nr:hypothetical protein HWV62_28126 [Athelia sp. TMB]